MLCCGFQELRLAGNVQCPHNTTDRGAKTGYRLGYLKMSQTESHQKQGTDHKDTCLPESNRIPDGRFFTLVPNKPKAVSVWRLFRPLGRAEGPMNAPCSQAALLVESVRSWIINRVNITLKPTPSLHWAENYQCPAPRAPISPLFLVGWFACLLGSAFWVSILFFLPNRPWILEQWPYLSFLQCKDSGMNHHGLLLKNTNSSSKYIKTLIKNDLSFRNLCFSNHKGTECGPWKS